jgi:hypothetical protein
MNQYPEKACGLSDFQSLPILGYVPGSYLKSFSDLIPKGGNPKTIRDQSFGKEQYSFSDGHNTSPKTLWPNS